MYENKKLSVVDKSDFDYLSENMKKEFNVMLRKALITSEAIINKALVNFNDITLHKFLADNKFFIIDFKLNELLEHHDHLANHPTTADYLLVNNIANNMISDMLGLLTANIHEG